VTIFNERLDARNSLVPEPRPDRHAQKQREHDDAQGWMGRTESVATPWPQFGHSHS
jgi:hypothetical protein